VAHGTLLPVRNCVESRSSFRNCCAGRWSPEGSHGGETGETEAVISMVEGEERKSLQPRIQK
jgi:hypothetical protein